MNNSAPKLQTSIITRPCMDENGEASKSGRFLGEIYVFGSRLFTSIDTDTEGAAIEACVKHMERYNEKHGVNYYFDAMNGGLKPSS